MGERLSLRERYRRLIEKARSPKSVDIGRGAIFIFDKYCRHCGAGLSDPGPYEKKDYLKLYRRGFCSDRCRNLGPRRRIMMRMSETRTVRRATHIIEIAAFIGAQIRRAGLGREEQLVMYANNQFRMVSEKLRWLEVQTKKRWHPEQFYRVLKRIQEKMGVSQDFPTQSDSSEGS